MEHFQRNILRKETIWNSAQSEGKYYFPGEKLLLDEGNQLALLPSSPLVWKSGSHDHNIHTCLAVSTCQEPAQQNSGVQRLHTALFTSKCNILFYYNQLSPQWRKRPGYCKSNKTANMSQNLSLRFPILLNKLRNILIPPKHKSQETCPLISVFEITFHFYLLNQVLSFFLKFTLHWVFMIFSHSYLHGLLLIQSNCSQSLLHIDYF